MRSSFPAQRPAAILFDHDGVLVSSEHLHLDAWKFTLEQFQIPVQLDLIQKLAGRGPHRLIRDYLSVVNLKKPPSDMLIEVIAASKHKYFMELMESGAQLMPGVAEGVAWLNEVNIRAAIVSNAREMELQHTLDRHKLHPYFAKVFSRDNTPFPKPDPRAYLMAASALKLDPSDCWVVEDSPSGASAGLAGGFQTFIILSSFSPQAFTNLVVDNPELEPTAYVKSTADFFHTLKTL